MTQPGIYIASARQLSVFIGRCEPCNRPVRATTDLFSGDHYPVACPDCGKFSNAQRLYGTVSKMECHGACMGAYGKTCDCACGGINHGDIWSRPGEMLADALAIYREDRAKRVAAAERASATRARQKAERLRAAFESWSATRLDLLNELIGTNWLTHRYPNDFLADMRNIIEREEILTEPQEMRTVAILARRREVAERVAAEQAEREAHAAEQAGQEGALFVMVPTERRFIEGEIKEAWPYDGDWGVSYKVKIECAEFNVVGTLPENLVSEALPQPYSGEDYRNLRHTLPGRRVKLKATLKPADTTPGKGYYSRPSNAEFVSAPEPAVT
jgi:hypothetical protein